MIIFHLVVEFGIACAWHIRFSLCFSFIIHSFIQPFMFAHFVANSFVSAIRYLRSVGQNVLLSGFHFSNLFFFLLHTMPYTIALYI